MSISGVGSSNTNTSLAYLLQSLETSQSNQTSQTSRTSQPQGIAALLTGVASSSAATSGVTSVAGGDSTSISKTGQLFGELQQLQSQDPTKFQQVTAQIASQLQTASQQLTGSVSNFLSNLADKFQTASTTGSVASLQPPQFSHPEGTYNNLGQISAASALIVPGTSSAPTTGITNLSHLFAKISQEVKVALGA